MNTNAGRTNGKLDQYLPEFYLKKWISSSPLVSEQEEAN
jgi:hypothetical protein